MELRPPRPPDHAGADRGIPWCAWLPEAQGPWPGVVILHGSGSRKESHADFGRAAAAVGIAALAYDQRGHGASEGEMSPRALDDVRRLARRLASIEGVDSSRIAARGSSFGGFMAIHAAAVFDELAAVVAICPAGEEHLRRGLAKGELDMRADRRALDAWLGEMDVRDAAALMGSKPLLLLHAEDDEQIPCAFSSEIYDAATEPKRLIALPGGHHRSIQHDAEMQGESLRWLGRALAEHPARH